MFFETNKGGARMDVPCARRGVMDIDKLQEFVYLAQTLSFKSTANHFYMTQSVPSKHISQGQ